MGYACCATWSNLRTSGDVKDATCRPVGGVRPSQQMSSKGKFAEREHRPEAGWQRELVAMRERLGVMRNVCSWVVVRVTSVTELYNR